MSVVSGVVGAVMGSDATESAAQTGAAAQNAATAAQERIYEQMRADFEPYRQIGLASLPYLQSAVLGGSYSVPGSGYSLVSPEELAKINAGINTNNQQNSMTYQPSAPTPFDPNYAGTPGRSAGPIAVPTSGFTPQTLYDPSKTWYRAPDGSLVNQAPTQQVSFTPGESPAAKYQREKGNVALQRALAARGLGGSGYATSKVADLESSIAASDWENQYNRLLDLTKIGTGASSATGSAGQGLSAAYGQGAQNLGNIASQAGAAKAGLYSGLGAASANTVSAGMKAYDYGKNAGWWGGSSGLAEGTTDDTIAWLMS